MKKLLHFLLFIVGLTLCACTSESNNDGGFDPLSGYGKKFDFSNIDTEGLLIIDCWGDYGDSNDGTVTYPIRELWGKDYVVILGKRNDTYAWIGVFDYFSRKCIYDYTDWGKPIGHTEYGEEVKYDVTEIWPTQLTFGDNYFTAAMRYSDWENNRIRIDFVVYTSDNNTIRRTILDEMLRSAPLGSHNVGNLYGDFSFFYLYHTHPESQQAWFYNSSINEIMVLFTFNYSLPQSTALNIIKAAFTDADYTQSRILINPNDVESWLAYTSPDQSIKLVAYDHGELSDVQEVAIFDEYTGSYDQAPRYAVEYLEQEADSHLLKVTRTEYNGTRESKKVHIYIYDNEYNIKIE